MQVQEAARLGTEQTLRLPNRAVGASVLRGRLVGYQLKRGITFVPPPCLVQTVSVAAVFLRSLSFLHVSHSLGLCLCMPSALAHYESFLINNVSVISTLESSLRSITWILPGRFKDAELASEAR